MEEAVRIVGFGGDIYYHTQIIESIAFPAILPHPVRWRRMKTPNCRTKRKRAETKARSARWQPSGKKEIKHVAVHPGALSEIAYGACELVHRIEPFHERYLRL